MDKRLNMYSIIYVSPQPAPDSLEAYRRVINDYFTLTTIPYHKLDSVLQATLEGNVDPPDIFFTNQPEVLEKIATAYSGYEKIMKVPHLFLLHSPITLNTYNNMHPSADAVFENGKTTIEVFREASIKVAKELANKINNVAAQYPT